MHINLLAIPYKVTDLKNTIIRISADAPRLRHNISLWKSAFPLAHGCAVAKKDTQNRDAPFAVLTPSQCTRAQGGAPSTKLTNLPEQTTNMRNMARLPSTVCFIQG